MKRGASRAPDVTRRDGKGNKQAKWPASGRPLRASSVAVLSNARGNVEICFHSPDDTLFAIGEVLSADLPGMILALLDIEAQLRELAQPARGTA